MRKLNFTILLAILTIWSANTLAAEVCNAMAITEKGGYGTGSKPTAAKAKKQAMSSCGLANPKDTCVVISVACQKQDKETDTKQTGKVVDYLDWRDGLAYEKGSKIPFTGKLLRHHYNGQKWLEENYKAGKKEGIHTKWYENGQKHSEGNYKASKREGIHTTWHYNGQKGDEGNYKADKMEGIHRFWWDNGQKSGEANYKADEAVGKITQWSRDGKRY